MSNDKVLAVIVEHIPGFLKEFLLWCVWASSFVESDGSERQGKFPVSATTGRFIGVDRPHEWVTFGEADAAHQRGIGVGLGVLLRPQDYVVGVDLDDAIDDAGNIKPWAARIVDSLPTYWERSPSARGLRAFLRGSLPPNCPKKLRLPDGAIEVYCQGRFLTVTGHRLPGSTADVVDCPDELMRFLSTLMVPPSAPQLQPSAASHASASHADAERIASGCAWFRHCRDDAATLSEPEWYGLLSILGRCADGERLAHDWSRPYPTYSVEETAAKLEQALSRSGPVTCSHVENSLGQARYCQACPNRGHVRSAVVLGMGIASVETWPEPEPLESVLVQVARFDPFLLPETFRPYGIDVAERLQVPLDFLGATLIVSFGSVVGRRARIRPKRHDDWEECSNLWGGVVADPGSMKTPSIKRVLKILYHLEEEGAQQYVQARAEFEQEQQARGEREMAWRREAGARAAQGDDPGVFSEPEPQEPTCVRYVVNDATVPKLQLIMSENPAGVLVFRDELAGFFGMLDSKGRESERPFYLESWAGDQPFTIDRVTRGTIRAGKICLSLFGGIQPTVLRRYLLGAILGGDGDDGLPQRLQILVYPDPTDDWQNIDREPDRHAEEFVTSIFRYAASQQPEQFVARFDPTAQEYFNQWRHTLEHRLRREPMPSYLQAHLAKYRGLMPRLAMLCHIANRGFVPEVPVQEAERAAAWCTYLESHAKRVYSEGSPRSIAAVLGDKLRDGALGTRFTVRQLQKKCWSGLTHHTVIRAVLRELEDSGWIRREPGHSTERGGRPAEAYRVNPRVYDGHSSEEQ